MSHKWERGGFPMKMMLRDKEAVPWADGLASSHHPLKYVQPHRSSQLKRVSMC